MDAYRISHIYYVDPFIQAVTNGVASIRHASPAHCHDFYEFFLVTRGSCIHQVNGHAQHLPEGALVFMRPDDHHAYQSVGESDCEFINTAFLNEALDAALAYLGDNGLSARLCAGPLPPVVSLSQGEVHRFIEQTRTMKMLAAIDKPRCRLLFRTQLAEVLLRFTQTGTRTAGDPLPLWLESLLLQMQKKEHFTAGLGRLCMLSGRSPGHVNRVFKKVLGETPTGYLNRLKLDHARHLLTATGMKVVEIALECGFDNLSHFHHTFRRIYGVTPARMRALNRSA
mgnify:FL=1